MSSGADIQLPLGKQRLARLVRWGQPEQCPK